MAGQTDVTEQCSKAVDIEALRLENMAIRRKLTYLETKMEELHHKHEIAIREIRGYGT